MEPAGAAFAVPAGAHPFVCVGPVAHRTVDWAGPQQFKEIPELPGRLGERTLHVTHQADFPNEARTWA